MLQIPHDCLSATDINDLTSMVCRIKVLCRLFDKIEMLIPGDSRSIFTSLDKM